MPEPHVCTQGEDGCLSPIVVNLDEGTFRFTSAEEGVEFDIDADGERERISWTDPARMIGLLVMDRNGNESIDSGAELFGMATAQFPPGPYEALSGYRALAVYDRPAFGGNDDGWISPADGVYESLQLWFDGQDGVSQPWELVGLADAGVTAIDLSPVISNRRDRHGNRLRWASHAEIGGHHRPVVADVIFVEAR